MSTDINSNNNISQKDAQAPSDAKTYIHNAGGKVVGYTNTYLDGSWEDVYTTGERVYHPVVPTIKVSVGRRQEYDRIIKNRKKRKNTVRKARRSSKAKKNIFARALSLFVGH